jgi:hypothetical protein
LIALCMPWNGSTDPSRARAHAWVSSYWRRNGFDVIEGTGSSRSEMCNAAARLSDGAEVLIFVDADTFTPISQVWDAAQLAQSTNRLVHAFTTYARLDQMTTKLSQTLPVDEIDPARLLRGARTTTKHVSGASAISRTLWECIGGFDERFTTYGREDVAFQAAAETLGGAVERIDGPAFHFWHRSDPNKALRPRRDDPQVQLVGRYCQAAGRLPEYGQTRRLGESGYFKIPDDAQPDPDAMRAVLSEPGGPLSTAGAEQVV